MRMTFEGDDEDAYQRRRDELGEHFAQWLTTHGVPGDANDAALLMDWKWSYADGRLDHWSVPDVHEFLFEWCTRKLSAAPEDCRELPLSVAAFVEFLAHTGLLAPGSAGPPTIRKHCERNVDAFVREMGDPANFGMAKSFFSGVGPDPDLDMLSPADGELPDLPPVRLPPERERVAGARAAPIMGQMRTLAEYCATPGRKLTATGNLTPADARHLVDALRTGDDPELGGVGKLQSGDQLPGLTRLVDLAVEAGVVRRQKGRLVAVASFAALDDCTAHEKVVLAAVHSDLTGPSLMGPIVGQVDATAHLFTTALLAELLRHGSGGIERDLVDVLMGDLLEKLAPGMPDSLQDAIVLRTQERLGELVDLGVLRTEGGTSAPCDDCGSSHQEGGSIAITAAGVPITIELMRELGVETPLRPEPADADVSAIVDLFDQLGEEELRRDVTEWCAAQPDRLAAVTALAAETLAAHRSTVTAMTGLTLLDKLDADAVEVVRSHLEGPHDGLVLQWLFQKDALDPGSVDPARLSAGLIDFLAAALDAAGPADVIDVLDEMPKDDVAEVLGDVWRLDHPRLPEVLGVIGEHHPAKTVAKAARKALMKHKSRSGAPR